MVAVQMMTPETHDMAKPNHHPANVRIKRRYLIWMKEARGYSVASIDIAAAAIERFESHTGYRDFKRLHVEQILAFKRHLSEETVTVKSGQPLSRATTNTTANSALSSILRPKPSSVPGSPTMPSSP